MRKIKISKGMIDSGSMEIVTDSNGDVTIFAKDADFMVYDNVNERLIASVFDKQIHSMADGAIPQYLRETFAIRDMLTNQLQFLNYLFLPYLEKEFEKKCPPIVKEVNDAKSK